MTTSNDQVLQLDLSRSIIRATYDGIHEETCQHSTCYITVKLGMSSVAKDNAAHLSSMFGLRAKPANEMLTAGSLEGNYKHQKQ